MLPVATLLTLAYGARVEDAFDRRMPPGSWRAPPRALAPTHPSSREKPGRTVSVIRHGIAWLRRLLHRGRFWSRVWLLPEPWLNPSPTWRSPARPLHENPIHTPVSARTGETSGQRFHDLFIAFGVDPEAYRRSNGYIDSEQGKPPDFVLEIASRSTGGQDTTDKRRDYAALGIPEYWRFGQTGEFHGTRLAGDRLVEGRYEPVPIEESNTASCRATAPR